MIEKFKSEGARNTVDIMMRPEPVANQFDQKLNNIKEISKQNISRIDNVLADLEEEDDNNANEQNLSDI